VKKECKIDEEDEETGEEEDPTNYSDKYEILQTRPRKVYDDKDQTLEAAGFYPRGAMLVV